MVCSEIPFVGDLCLVETSQLICCVNHLTDICLLWVSTERYLRNDYRLFYPSNYQSNTVVKASIVSCSMKIGVL